MNKRKSVHNIDSKVVFFEFALDGNCLQHVSNFNLWLSSKSITIFVLTVAGSVWVLWHFIVRSIASSIPNLFLNLGCVERPSFVEPNLVP